MIKKVKLTIITLTLASKMLIAQVSGEGTYQFLNSPTSARVTALGGKIGSLDESDISTVMHNPALLDSSMHNALTISYINLFSGITYGAFGYARNYNSIGMFAVGGQRIDYGSFTRADETGTTHGTFTASEMAFNLAYARTFDTCFSIGINLKPMYSHLDSYTSWGIAADIAGNYTSKNGLFSAGIAFKNIGTMLKSYAHAHEPLPFEIVAGISKKLAHAPFRFVVTLQQLQNLDLYYETDSFSEESVFDESEKSSQNIVSRTGKEMLSHLILGAEFIPVRNFYLRVGYNYQRRNEMKIREKVSTVGFSWGIGIKISKFHISYSRATLHLAGSTNHFAITTDFDNFFKKH